MVWSEDLHCFVDMSFIFRANMTVTEPNIMQWPLTVGLSTLAAAFFGFVAFLSYTPAVHENRSTVSCPLSAPICE